MASEYDAAADFSARRTQAAPNRALLVYLPRSRSFRPCLLVARKTTAVQSYRLNTRTYPSVGNSGSFNEHLCPSGGKTRLAENTYGANFHFLSSGSNRACQLLFQALRSFYGDRDRRRDPAFRPLRKDYERYHDDTVGNCFCAVLFVRLAFSSQHSRSDEFDVEQRAAKSLGSWTPFRLRKIALR